MLCGLQCWRAMTYTAAEWSDVWLRLERVFGPGLMRVVMVVVIGDCATDALSLLETCAVGESLIGFQSWH